MVGLAGPKEVSMVAIALRGAFMQYAKATREGATIGSGGTDDIAKLQNELQRAMRADLGEPDS
jgi:hypothetical protein